MVRTFSALLAAALAATTLHIADASARTSAKPTIVLVHGAFADASGFGVANEVSNVKALVYLNALALDEGESNLDIIERFPNEFVKTLVARPFQLPDGTQGADLYIDPAKFPSVFAADIPTRTAALMASAQRPLSAAASQEKLTTPGWKAVPSWYLVGRQDEVINPAAQRFMAKRANAHTVAINSAHASYISHPAEVTTLILRAVRSIRR